MRKTTNKKPISINPETIRLMSLDTLPKIGGATGAPYGSCTSCGTLTKFC